MPELKDFHVRPFSSPAEYEAMIEYFVDAEDSFLKQMGVDRSLLPAKQDWLRDLLADHQRPDHQKDRFYVGWFHHDRQIGHSSVNKIRIGEEAFFHLHLWCPDGVPTCACQDLGLIFAGNPLTSISSGSG